MYNINILSDCGDEKVRAAIVTAVMEVMSGNEDLFVGRMKRGKVESPIWNIVSRQEILDNTF